MRIRLSLLSSLLPLCWATGAFAQSPEENAARDGMSGRDRAARSEIVVGVVGPFDAEARAALVRLLRAELEPNALTVVEADPRGETRDWAREVTKGNRTLLAVLLDTRDSSGWRLVVIDSARGRAISRELPRGERDAANVEAVVSIVLSATNALREGLEVASAPLESVVDPERQSPAPPAPRPAPPRTPAPKPRANDGTTLHASAALEGATFGEGAEPMFGASIAAGVSIVSLVDVELGVARTLPKRVESEFGSFELERTALVLSAGPVFRSGALALVPAAAFATEWIQRAETQPAAGVGSPDDEATSFRLGARVELRGRYRLVSNRDAELVSLVGSLGASYFDGSVRFLAGDEVLVEARPGAFHAGLGLFIATDAL